MKKSVKVTMIIIAAIIAVLIIVPFALRGKIDTIVKREASAMLNASLSFDKLGISLLRHFPNASLDLNQIALVGVDKFEGDTLVSAERISVVVNIMSLFSDSFKVNKLILDRPSVLAIKLKTGEVNWDIMKPSETPDENKNDTTDTSGSSFKLSMQDVRINNGRVTYIDSLSDMSFYTDDLNLRMKGDLSAAQSDLKLKLDSENIYYTMGKITMLKKAEVELNMDIAADIENGKYTFSDNKIRLNAIEVAVDGWVAMREKALDMDIKLNSSKVQFKEILSMIPAFYTKDFKELSAKGELTLAAWVKGELSEGKFPAFDVQLAVADGSFKYEALPKSVDNINIKAAVSNPGGSADNTVISVDKFTMALAGNTLNATFYASTPVSDMNFKSTANGSVNLGMIKEVYPLGDSISLSGLITADVAIAGKMSNIEKQQYESINASGTFSVKDMTAKLAGLPDVQISQAIATISPQALTLSSLQTKIGRSDLSATGSLSNYLAYALRNDKLTGRLDVKSKLLDLNELMGDNANSESASAETTKSSDTAKMTVFVVPENLNLAMSASVDKIEFQKMVLGNFNGAVSIANGTVKMDRLAMNAMGGKISANGSYSTANNPQAPQLAMALDIANCSFEQTFKELDMVKKIVPLFEKTGGNYSMKMDMTTTLNSEMSPELNTLSAKGVIESSNISIQNIKAFEALATALKDDRLKNIQAKDIKIPFTIEKGLIQTAPFDLKLGDINLNMSGTTGLDQSIDYTAKITMPKAVGGVLNNVNVKIGGTFTSPKITIGVKEMVEEAIKNALNQGVEKLTGGKDIKETVTEKSNQMRAEAAEKIRAEAKTAGDKLVEAARSEGDKLVSKANNPIAKIAAKKSAELMVKKAQEQAQKLMNTAEETINAAQ